MLHTHAIDSLEHPMLEPYRTMKRPLEHQRQGIFVAEGEKVVRRLLESDFTVVSLLLPHKWLEAYKPLLQERTEDIYAFTADKKLLEALTGFSMYQGVMAVGKIPAQLSLATMLEKTARPWFFAAVDGLTNADNLGVVVRNCAAFGVQALLIGETCCNPYLRKSVRSSMGTIFKLPTVEVPSLVGALKHLRERNVHCLAAHPHTNQITLSQTKLAQDCCVVFGAEGNGISPAVLAACNEAVAIPMHSDVDSLNVSSASAAFLYEVQRQRGKA